MTIFKAFALMLVASVCVSEAYNFESGSNGQVAWANGCNFYGNDISQQAAAGSACGDLCLANAQCNYFAWDNGICYMKRATNPPITDMPNAVCGWVISRVGTLSSWTIISKLSLSINNLIYFFFSWNQGSSYLARRIRHSRHQSLEAFDHRLERWK